MDLGLAGKVVIVTGGTRGIGRGCVEVLAQEGAYVLAISRNPTDEQRAHLAEVARRCSTRIEVMAGDVTDPETAVRAFDAAEELLGPVDCLVNNAGGVVGPAQPIGDVDDATWRAWQDANLNSQFLFTREFARRAIASGRSGAIVNVASKAAFSTNSTGNVAYISAKAGVVGLTRGSAKELIAHGIRVNALVPGYVETETSHKAGSERAERIRPLLPLGRFAQPEEMGRVVAFLLSEAASQIVGVCVDATGGTLL